MLSRLIELTTAITHLEIDLLGTNKSKAAVTEGIFLLFTPNSSGVISAALQTFRNSRV